jgi:hypothetical protein
MRVKIIKCSGDEYWYKNKIGEEFEVMLSSKDNRKFDYLMKELCEKENHYIINENINDDTWTGPYRLIEKCDCILVSDVKKMAKRKIYLKRVVSESGRCCINCYFCCNEPWNGLAKCKFNTFDEMDKKIGTNCSGLYYYKLIKIEEV